MIVAFDGTAIVNDVVQISLARPFTPFLRDLSSTKLAIVIGEAMAFPLGIIFHKRITGEKMFAANT